MGWMGYMDIYTHIHSMQKSFAAALQKQQEHARNE